MTAGRATRHRLLVRRESVFVALVAIVAGVLALPLVGSRTAWCDERSDAGDGFARITYVTPDGVYIDAGLARGLREGDVLEIVRAGAVVARLAVIAVSSRSALCRAIGASPGLSVGEPVRLASGVNDPARAPADSAAAAVSAPPPASAPPASPASRGGLREIGARGRVGVRFLATLDRSSGGSDVLQPALDVRLTDENAPNVPLGYAVDVRARRTYRRDADGDASSAGRTKVYRLASSWAPGDGGFLLTLGRQLSPSLAAVSVFDGALAEIVGARWRGGAFTGTQPDPATFRYSNSVREHGGYVQFIAGSDDPVRGSVTAGAIGSYQNGDVSREFVFLQSHLATRRVSTYLSQEIDLNRAWKADMESESVALTSTFSSVRYRPRGSLELSAGFDNRRSVRLYRDRVTPETDFDDSFRQGLWAGSELEPARGLRFGVRAQQATGGASGDARTFTATAAIDDALPARIRIGLRGSRYRNDRLAGWLVAVNGGAPLGSRLTTDAHFGVRGEDARIADASARRLLWIGTDFEANLSRRVFALLSLEATRGEDEDVDQAYSSISLRF